MVALFKSSAFDMSGPESNGATNAVNNAPRVPPVVGINFGNSYASIAVLNKASCASSLAFGVADAQQDHVPDCIANEDGERQIATALSFHGEQMVCCVHREPCSRL